MANDEADVFKEFGSFLTITEHRVRNGEAPPNAPTTVVAMSFLDDASRELFLPVDRAGATPHYWMTWHQVEGWQNRCTPPVQNSGAPQILERLDRSRTVTQGAHQLLTTLRYLDASAQAAVDSGLLGDLLWASNTPPPPDLFENDRRGFIFHKIGEVLEGAGCKNGWELQSFADDLHAIEALDTVADPVDIFQDDGLGGTELDQNLRKFAALRDLAQAESQATGAEVSTPEYVSRVRALADAGHEERARETLDPNSGKSLAAAEAEAVAEEQAEEEQ